MIRMLMSVLTLQPALRPASTTACVFVCMCMCPQDAPEFTETTDEIRDMLTAFEQRVEQERIQVSL